MRQSRLLNTVRAMRAFDIASVSQGIVSQDTVSRHTVSQRAVGKLREAHAPSRLSVRSWGSPPRGNSPAVGPLPPRARAIPAMRQCPWRFPRMARLPARSIAGPTGTRAFRRSPTLRRALAILRDGELSSITAVSQAASLQHYHLRLVVEPDPRSLIVTFPASSGAHRRTLPTPGSWAPRRRRAAVSRRARRLFERKV
jgi:hypothetical protein